MICVLTRTASDDSDDDRLRVRVKTQERTGVLGTKNKTFSGNLNRDVDDSARRGNLDKVSYTFNKKLVLNPVRDRLGVLYDTTTDQRGNLVSVNH
jgi:hypothetical protein